MAIVQAVEADTTSVIAKLAPILIQTAREVSSSQSSMENLNLISQEWATNVSITCTCQFITLPVVCILTIG